jgi:hypothetical protein
MKRHVVLALAASAGLVSALSPSGWAATDKSWNVGTGNWGSSGNWLPSGVPTSNDIVWLNRLVGGQRGVVSVSGTGFASPVSVNIRSSNELDIANFSALSVGGDVIVGYDSSVGFVNINSPQPGIGFFNGQMTVGNTLRLGFSSALGIVNQNDGTMTVNQLVRVGDRQASSPIFPGSGRYNLSGVGVLNAARLEVGFGGDSNQFAADGEFNLSGNAVLNVSLGAQTPDPRIGGGAGTGNFNQTGGTFNCPFRVVEIGGATGPGVYNFSGGVFNAPGVSLGNSGTINYTGGSNLSVGQLSTTNGHVNLGSGGGKTLRASLLWTNPGQWAIDLNDNAMVIGSTLGETVASAVARGRNGGAWNGNGITSSAARNQPQHSTTLGILSGSEYRSVYGTSATFGGQAVSDAQTLVKYTWYGDTDFNGRVNFDDYVRIDAGFNGHRSGWLNGDFDMNGVVNFDDYVLIDLAFNTQSGTLGRAVDLLGGSSAATRGTTSPSLEMVQQHFAEFGTDYARQFLAAVPEPTCAAALVATMTAVLRRRRRRSA